MNGFLAAALQLNSQPDIDESMNRSERAVDKAVHAGALFVGLPENFAFLGDERARHLQAEAISQKVITHVPEWAKKHGIYLMAGGFPVRAKSGKMFNRAMMVSPRGEIMAQYDKIHLFDISLSETESYRESGLVEPGEGDPVVCETSLGTDYQKTGVLTGEKEPRKKNGLRFGLSICYDVRFPELYRQLADKNADVLCVPSAFTRPTGEAHWEVLLRSRAIENTCFVIAPAQTGQHGKKRKTYGHSIIIDPWGRILADAGTEPGMAMAEIHPDYLQEIRQKLPSLQHRTL